MIDVLTCQTAGNGLYIFHDSDAVADARAAYEDALRSTWLEIQNHQLIVGFGPGVVYLGTVKRRDTSITLTIDVGTSPPDFPDTGSDQVFHGMINVRSNALRVGGTISLISGHINLEPDRYNIRILVPQVADTSLREPPLRAMIQFWPDDVSGVVRHD